MVQVFKYKIIFGEIILAILLTFNTLSVVGQDISLNKSKKNDSVDYESKASQLKRLLNLSENQLDVLNKDETIIDLALKNIENQKFFTRIDDLFDGFFARKYTLNQLSQSLKILNMMDPTYYFDPSKLVENAEFNSQDSIKIKRQIDSMSSEFIRNLRVTLPNGDTLSGNNAKLRVRFVPYDEVEDSVSSLEKLCHLHKVLNLVKKETSKVWEDIALLDRLYASVSDSLRIRRTRNLLDSYFMEKIDKNVLLLSLNLLIVHGSTKDFYFNNGEILEEAPLFTNKEEANDYLKSINHLILTSHNGNLTVIDGMQKH